MGGVYIHVPFCERKCPYCDFYSISAQSDLIEEYGLAVCRAVETAPVENFCADTLYFGGGTPSLLSVKTVSKIIEVCIRRFGLKDAEITFEANPHSASYDTLRGYRDAGVNRLSIGMQSADENQLRILGRLHTAKDTEDTVESARKAGFENISLDLMLGIPQQTQEIVEKSVEVCGKLGVDHVSAYLLKIEAGTPFSAMDFIKSCPDEDAQAELYLYAAQRLQKQGFAQYEISNFAKAGKKSRHNLKYWKCEDTLGIGPAAHSLVGGKRFYFPRDMRAFSDAPLPFSLVQNDGKGGDEEERLMLGLRLSEGVSLAGLQNPAAAERIRRQAEKFEKMGLMRVENDRIAFTAQGFLLSNTVLCDLLEALEG